MRVKQKYSNSLGVKKQFEKSVIAYNPPSEFRATIFGTG